MSIDFSRAQCPLPMDNDGVIQMSHGGGGLMMRRLLEGIVVPTFDNAELSQRHDGAVVPMPSGRLAFTTDSFVVRPLFFPGGDIGSLAVNGTVNDLSMCGARPLYLSCAFILEEGLPLTVLKRIVASMQQAARAAGVRIVTGDTKVVDRGKGDQIFINTAGVGVVEHGQTIAPSSVRAGDAVIISGDVARHGVAIMSQREGLEFETAIESDCAPLWPGVAALLDAGIEIHCLRDLTRGGLAAGLNEIARDGSVRIEIAESAAPVSEAARGACELLGLDPFYVANEGCFVAIVPERDATKAVSVLRALPAFNLATRLGSVSSGDPGRVLVETPLKTQRVLDLLSGEQLPRIC